MADKSVRPSCVARSCERSRIGSRILPTASFSNILANVTLPLAHGFIYSSPKVIPAERSLAPKFPVVEPPAPVAATNAAVTNIPAVDKAAKTPAPAVTPEKEKAPEAPNPVEKK